jgi:hypothetical protein
MRQLHLFASKRQRGRSPPPPMEFNIHVQLANILRRWCNPQWRWTHFPSGENRDHCINPKTGKRFSLTGQRLQRMGTQKGWPDFQFFGPDRRTFFLELKRPKRGVVSGEQADVLSHLIACGHSVLVTTSLDDAVAELKAVGILRSTVELH